MAMSQDDRIGERILEILSDQEMTTDEIVSRLEKEDEECSERAVRVLMLLKFRGKVVGEYSPERKSWLWKKKG